MKACDRIVIAGGGLAGSALACHLARAGREVVLCEKDTFPRDKVCGEFLSPEASFELDRLGLFGAVRALEPAEIRHLSFTAPSGRALESRLPCPALGVSRRRLDALLFAGARAAGAVAHEKTEVLAVRPDGERLVVTLARGSERTTDELDAAVVVAACGRRARLDRTLARDFMRARSPFVGVKRHHRPRTSMPELDGRVEIHTFDGGYCGLSFVEGGLVNVCALLEERLVGAIETSSWSGITRALSERNRHLAARLAKLEPSGETFEAVAEIPFGSKERAKDGVFFLGDAAGMIAPFAGDGQAMALTSARLLADLLLALQPSASNAERRVLERRWDRTWRNHFEPRMTLGRALQPLLLDGRAAAAALGAIGLVPGLASALVRLTRGG